MLYISLRFFLSPILRLQNDFARAGIYCSCKSQEPKTRKADVARLSRDCVLAISGVWWHP